MSKELEEACQMLSICTIALMEIPSGHTARYGASSQDSPEGLSSPFGHGEWAKHSQEECWHLVSNRPLLCLESPIPNAIPLEQVASQVYFSTEPADVGHQ